MSVTIRNLEARDRDSWLTLWRSYTDFYRVQIPDAVTDNTWRWIEQGTGPVWGLGAEQENVLIGFVTYQLHPVTWSSGPRCYLEDLFVTSQARLRGAGRALIEAVYAAADRAGADNVYWWTQTDNAAARRLYDRVGVHKGIVRYDRK